jgi:Glu-tRNA(Gln) amidotransferase subunit E-like FAD-binding protein
VKESKVSSTTVAAFMTETLISLKREGIALEKVSDADLRAMFRQVGEGKIAKEATTDVVSWLSKHEDKTIQDAVKELGIQSISKDDLNKLIARIVDENKRIIKERGEDSFGALMGIVMNTLRGKADAALVSRILKEKVKEAME